MVSCGDCPFAIPQEEYIFFSTKRVFQCPYDSTVRFYDETCAHINKYRNLMNGRAIRPHVGLAIQRTIDDTMKDTKSDI